MALDDIPNEFFYESTKLIINSLVVYFSSVLNHGHVCLDISYVLLVPTFKDRLKKPI